MRHVEHPLIRHGVVVEVEHLLAGRAATYSTPQSTQQKASA